VKFELAYDIFCFIFESLDEFTVAVKPGPKPPIFYRPNGTNTQYRYPRYVPENVPVGTNITFPVIAYKPDGLPVVYPTNIFGLAATPASWTSTRRC